jgi:uncharacterized protein YndB with AHSA1/START domain/uncharacterized protein YciI
MSSLPPLRRQIVVPAGPQTAFDVFTEKIGDWWPVHRHSVYGARASAAFRDGRLVETGPDGDESVWGQVLDWEPPHRLRLTWHPGHAAERASEVEVTFVPVADALTLVTVEHRNWEHVGDPAAARKEYGNGWPAVLASYASSAASGPAAASAPDPVWLVLSYTTAPGVTDPFARPEFRGHPAFLERLREQGVLVAAGPFPASGAGMTVVRLPDPGAVAGLIESAYADDGSVTGGVLEVQVRPWVVMVTGSSLA